MGLAFGLLAQTCYAAVRYRFPLDPAARSPTDVRTGQIAIGLAFHAATCGCAADRRRAAHTAQPERPTSVVTRPDPFQKLALIASGRFASIWSSLPEGAGCQTDQQALSGHAMLLAEPSQAGQDTPEGPFTLVEPTHRLQLDATLQTGCVFGQLALQRQADPAGDYWSWDGSAVSWRIDEYWRVGAGRVAHQWGPTSGTAACC